MQKLNLIGRLKVARFAASIAKSVGQNPHVTWRKSDLVSLVEETFNKMIELIESPSGIERESEVMSVKSR